MRAAGYIRVSTEEQSREGVSLEMQITKIRQYCELNELELVGIYGDPGISGKSIKARPGIQAVLEMVDRKRIDHVVVYKLDRLARNTIETLEMVERMDKKSVSLHSISEKLDTQSAIGRFVVRTLASLAEMERDQVSERTTGALQSKRARGEKTGGDCPFGYDFQEVTRPGTDKPLKVLVENPEEQEIVARIRNLKAKGHSFRAIAAEQNSDGLVTKQGKTWTHRQIARVYEYAKAA